MNKSLLLLCATGMLLAANPVFAQRDAGSKARGDYNFYSSGRMYQRHAHDHAQVLQDYATSGKTVPKAIIKEHANAIRSNVAATKKAYSGMSEEARKEAAKSLAVIEKAHAKVLETCNMLDECCKAGDGDSTTVHKCCITVADQMKVAQDEYEKLGKQLKLEAPPAAPKK